MLWSSDTEQFNHEGLFMYIGKSLIVLEISIELSARYILKKNLLSTT